MIETSDALTILDRDIHPLWRKVNAGLTNSLAAAFAQWSVPAGEAVTPGDAALSERMVHFLSSEIGAEAERILRLRTLHAEFAGLHGQAGTDQERQRLILNFARDLGADDSMIEGDRKAFSRWFGRDAVTDRYRRRVALAERKISFCLNRIGSITRRLLKEQADAAGARGLWRRLSIEQVVRDFFVYDGDSRVCVEAFRTLTDALRALPEELRESSVESTTVRSIYRLALENRGSVWLQAAALRLLESLSLPSLTAVLRHHLTRPVHDRDHLFLRRRAVISLGANLDRDRELLELIPVAASDPSALVRQALPQALTGAPPEMVLGYLGRLALADTASQVRAAAILHAVPLLDRKELTKGLLAILDRSCRGEQDPFVLRTLLKVCADGYVKLIENGDGGSSAAWLDGTAAIVKTLHEQAASLSVRRWAAQARERIWCEGDPAARRLREALTGHLADLPPGKWRRIPRSLLGDADDSTIGRVFSVMAQQDYGFELRSGPLGTSVIRGHTFRLRLWRVIHEFLSPSPDKRLAFPHTIGRVFRGDVHIPSAIMAEQAETKVPGEPLFIDSESGWRPYLPLMDEVLSALTIRGRSVRIVTSEGVTEMVPPKGILKRLWSRLILTARFPRYARLRNWREEGSLPPSSYVAGLGSHGVEVRFSGHPSKEGGVAEDGAVRRFFPAFFPAWDTDLAARVREYFFSVYENSIEQLALYAAVLASLFLGHKFYQSYRVRALRKKFPLVIGGWGTRGKSGTERMKSALVNALGFGVLSKTTGCEAMFLHAYPYDTLREMFLFRPYDKATIWEQHNVFDLAGRLDADLMLWECMALSPAYVRILQHGWLKDSISTITNAYPDHEDIQGPAGINIPEVMTDFIPPSAVLVTTEELMAPVFVEAAKKLGTRVRRAGWLEAGLLTDDVMSRFPYEEHSYNVALLLELAEELGIEKDFALKETADRIIPDIGVLKIHPVAKVRSRELQFVNGMSANDRFGCLSNWVRTGFAGHDPGREPGVWISTVINNRADRIVRSQVFAGVIAADVSADRHFVIGSNLKGLMGYIRDAWERTASQMTLARADGEAAAAVFEKAARRMRIPISPDDVSGELRAILVGVGADFTEEELPALAGDEGLLTACLSRKGPCPYTDGILARMRARKALCDQSREFLGRITESPGQEGRLDRDFRKLLTGWFMAKFIVIEDARASGEEIIERIVEETPPGFTNRIMGMQNIKGTGLDFVYRWQAWDNCHNACSLLKSRNPSEAEQGLRTLSTFREYGLLSEEHVRDTVEEVRRSPVAQSERFQAELSVILSTLDTEMKAVRARLAERRGKGIVLSLMEGIEAFLDAGDSIRRRKNADRIYRDLADERISHERAAVELQELNKRQKGGWLPGQVLRMMERLTNIRASGR